MGNGMVSAHGTTYKIEATTPPNRCHDCRQPTNKMVGRMSHRGFRKPPANAPAGIFYCVACHAVVPIFKGILEDIISDAESPWEVDELIATGESRQRLADGWMDDAWHTWFDERLSASGLDGIEYIWLKGVLIAEGVGERFDLRAKDAWWLVSLGFDPEDPHKVAPA